MKKLLALLMALMMCCTAFAFAEEEAEVPAVEMNVSFEAQTVTLGETGLTMQIPADWAVQEVPAGTENAENILLFAVNADQTVSITAQLSAMSFETLLQGIQDAGATEEMLAELYVNENYCLMYTPGDTVLALYTMTAWEHNSKITLTKNPYYHAVDKVTMDELDFYLSDDANNMLANFQKGDWQLIDDVPTSEIASLKEQYPTEFVIAGQIGTYYVCWNINEEILPADVLANMTPEEAEAARAEVRRAIGLLFDRNYIVEEIGQAGQVPASSFVPMGMTDADGSEFYKNAGHVEGITGYYDVTDDEDVYMANFDKAVETLKKYYTYDEENGVFTNFPSLTYLYNTSEAHKAIGEYLQSAVSAVGITMNLTNQEWNTFLNTRKSGDYSIARNGWIADYNDPICFLDMWVTGSGNNDVQFGKGANADLKIYNLDLTPYGYDVKVENGTWAETYDVLISAIKSCTIIH